jgi:hypothetical protein
MSAVASQIYFPSGPALEAFSDVPLTSGVPGEHPDLMMNYLPISVADDVAAINLGDGAIIIVNTNDPPGGLSNWSFIRGQYEFISSSNINALSLIHLAGMDTNGQPTVGTNTVCPISMASRSGPWAIGNDVKQILLSLNMDVSNADG